MKHLIIGAGAAGVTAAEELRRLDPTATITVLDGEGEGPYSRMAIPYLLANEIPEDGTRMRHDPAHYRASRIDIQKGRAARLDPSVRTVRLEDGRLLEYDRLLVATGSVPTRERIEGIDLPGVHTCWTLEDARAIAALAKPGSRVVQLGAGFIGCIIMQALAERGVDLTVVEMGDRMVPRMMTSTAGTMIREWVESKGIRVRTQAGVDRVDPGTDAPLTVKLSTGEALPCDLLIVAAGVVPNVSFLESTPVHVAKGVLVNDYLETSVPGIYAAGDVAEAPDLFTGAHLVSAIQPNAADQARVAALNMAGQKVKLPGVLAINVLDTLGLISTSFGQWWGTEDKDGVELVDRDHHRYLSLQFQGEVLIGATAIGLTQHVGVLRGLIQNRTRLGRWKAILLEEPLRFPEAYVACSQQPVALVH